jgi:hypothetical protein
LWEKRKWENNIKTLRTGINISVPQYLIRLQKYRLNHLKCNPNNCYIQLYNKWNQKLLPSMWPSSQYHSVASLLLAPVTQKLWRCKQVVFTSRTCVNFRTLLASKPLAGVYEVFISMYPDKESLNKTTMLICHLLFGFHLSRTHVLYMRLQKNCIFSLISLCNMCRECSWNWDKRKSEINPPNQAKNLVYYIFLS